MARRTGLYRLFGFDGTLLYVGSAFDPEARWRQCRMSRERWAQIDHSRTTVEWFDSRTAAEIAEVNAIQAERPAWNVRDVSPDRTALDVDRHVTGRHLISLPDDMWEELADRTGARNRSYVIRLLVTGYLSGEVECPNEQLNLFAA